ncbi:hypothetical protein OJAV_G00230100 [Oryzias javanicus]|uniref:Uncharacterized protein n=1 Tax=Oryzias javanicus TaxID=123683 RepID=A0A3S2PMM1_ORYJA|nr:hypothetical protein OJAV_G00230100 [Oryzias javanicus]
MGQKDFGYHIHSTSFASLSDMNADRENNTTGNSKSAKEEFEKSAAFSRGRGFRGHGRGGRMGRGSMRGGRGMMKGFGPPGRGRGRGMDGAMNGFGSMRMGRMQPYPDMRGFREAICHPCPGMDPAPRLLLVFLVLEAPRHSLEGCDLADLCALSILVAREATTKDRSLLLRLTPHLAQARGGQAPLVGDAFYTTCPPKNL